MPKRRSRSGAGPVIAVSGGPDSIYLLCRTFRLPDGAPVIGHFNHAARGPESDGDADFVRRFAENIGVPVVTDKAPTSASKPGTTGGPVLPGVRAKTPAGFEASARDLRYRFLRDLKRRSGSQRILLAHTADDQVETVLMRILEGAGIAGLKGIPRYTGDGIERPLLDTWRKDIIEYLRKHKVSSRIDASNEDIRFERNWIRHVLIPLLEKRYGKAVKKRIFALGERFREIDEFLEATARRWMRRHVGGGASRDKRGPEGSGRGRRWAASFGAQSASPSRTGRPGGAGSRRTMARLARPAYSRLPAAVRKKVLQLLFFERLGVAPNERLLESVDRVVREGGPSATLDVGKGAVVRCRYDEVLLEAAPAARAGRASKGSGPAGRSAAGRAGKPGSGRGEEPGRALRIPGPGRYGGLLWEGKGKVAAAALRRIASGEEGAAFDLDGLRLPLAARPLKPGDRIRPFGLGAEKKVKEILIDRKVPRGERWGRPVVCDAGGAIIWIPGVVRSDAAPVTGATRRTAVLRLDDRGAGRRNPEA